MKEFNQIYCEDCYEGMKEIPDQSIDLVITDPPYGTTACDWDHKIDIEGMFSEILRVSKENAAIVIFSQLPFAVDLINAQRKLFRYEWIWEKSIAVGFMNVKKMPLRAHENILVFYRKLPTYNPQFRQGEPYISLPAKRDCPIYNLPSRIPTISDGNRYPRDLIKMGKGKSVGHPTAKPLELVKYLIKTYSNEGEVVLDPFAGSCPVAVGCLELNRKYICFERESKYVEIGNERIKKYLSTPKQTSLIA